MNSNTLDPQQPEIQMVISAFHARRRLDQVKAIAPKITKRLGDLVENEGLAEMLQEENLPRGNEIPWNGVREQTEALETITQTCEMINRQALNALSALELLEYQFEKLEKAIDTVDQIDFSQDQGKDQDQDQEA